MAQYIDIDGLAKLSGIALSEAEAAQIEYKLHKLLKLMENLKELDYKPC
jgi:aspartyl/glutamyl-tRNA(Asn/Gln) amidotransferase C subunit